MNGVLKGIAVVALILVGLVGLGMSLCGGLITFAGLLPSGSSGGEFKTRDMLVISIPSLIAGLGLAWAASSRLRRMARDRRDAATPERGERSP